MYKLLPVFLVFAISFLGCGESAPPPPAEPAAPPPPTAQEIRSEMRNAFGVLAQASGPEAYLPAAVKDEAVSAFNQVKSKHANSVNGPQALQEIVTDVEQLISTARNNEAWMAAKGAIEIYKSLNPTSERYNTLEERADIMLARPRVQVTGFAEVDGTTEIFLRVLDDQKQPPVESYTVREGEEFHEKDTGMGLRPILKVVRIIGNNSEVELEYLPIEDTWTVPGPRQ